MFSKVDLPGDGSVPMPSNVPAIATSTDQYWVSRWIDEYEVKTDQDAASLLNLPGPMERLGELAASAPTYGSPGQRVPDISVAAGSGIDFSGHLSCGSYRCMRAQFESSYNQMFHYFDYVVAQGYSPREVLRCLREWPKARHDELHESIRNEVMLLKYLREIGADKYVIFREKPQDFCLTCLKDNADFFGMSPYGDADLLRSAAERLAAEARIERNWYKGAWRFWVYHDFFDGPAMTVIQRAKSKPPAAKEVATDVILEYSNALVNDVVFAHHLNVPLAHTIESNWLADNGGQVTVAENDVALNLQLPILQGVSIRELLKLREEERPFFDQFRNGIRLAIRDQIARHDSSSPSAVAQSVVQEYVEPALADIDRRLRVNQRRLSRKAVASVAVGTAATSAGLISSLPLVLGAGIAAIGAALTHVYKYVDDLGEIELSDMYFLWKVGKITGRGH
jgi:hypothetical protein